MFNSLSDRLPLEDLTAAEVAKENTVFTFTKLPPMQAYRLLDQLRERVGNKVDEIMDMKADGDSRTVVGRTMIATLLKMPHKDIEFARAELFKAVSFRRPNVPTPLPLAGSEDMAFDGLNPGDIYEIMVRAFMVNFTDTFSRVLSASGEPDPTTNPSSQP